MIDAEMQKLPTNIDAEYVTSYRFMQRVNMISPESAVNIAIPNMKINSANGNASLLPFSLLLLDAFKIVNESFKKF